MAKKGKKSVPVIMKKSEKRAGGKIFIGTIGGVNMMLHTAGKPWKSGTSIVHNNKEKNPKNVRRDGKLAIKKDQL